MIELKTYHSIHSAEIQEIWKNDQWLLSKITKIASKLILENIAIFFYNQTTKTRNYFKVKKPAKPSPKDLVVVPNYPLKFSSTVQSTLFGTLFWRGSKSLLGWAVPLREKVANCGERASFQWINQIKQLELKNFALASAAIPFAINFVNHVNKQPKDLPLTKKISNTVKKQFSTPLFIFYTSMIGLALTNPLYGRALGLTSKNGFDSSGHLMLKIVLAPVVGAALSQTAVDHPHFATAYALFYSFTDGIFLKNTTQYCHTAIESLTGFAWGLGIIAAAAAITRSYALLSPQEIR